MEKPMPCRPRGVSRHVAVLSLSHCGEHDAVGCLEGFGVSSDHGEAVPQHGSDGVLVIHSGTLSLFKDAVSKEGHPFGCCDFSSWVLGFVLQPCVGVTHAPPFVISTSHSASWVSKGGARVPKAVTGRLDDTEVLESGHSPRGVRGSLSQCCSSGRSPCVVSTLTGPRAPAS